MLHSVVPTAQDDDKEILFSYSYNYVSGLAVRGVSWCFWVSNFLCERLEDTTTW